MSINAITSNMKSSITDAELTTLKNKIESMKKEQHIEILKVIKNKSGININENKNGVFINLSYLEPDVLEEIQKYMEYITDQENVLNPIESLKTNYLNEIQKQPEDDEETMNSNEQLEDDNDFITVYR